MQYGDKLIDMQGIIVEVNDGAVSIDLKGRLGFLRIPLRMLITDYPLEIGQEIGFRMSFPEVISQEAKEKYVSNLKKRKEGKS